MPIFSDRFYHLGKNRFLDIDGYKLALRKSLDSCASSDDRQSLLRQEVIEITMYVTNGIRDLIKTDKHIHNIVLNQGDVPLAFWTRILDGMALAPLPVWRKQIDDMRSELENGRIQGFPATMELHDKPTFATLDGFYRYIFELVDSS